MLNIERPDDSDGFNIAWWTDCYEEKRKFYETISDEDLTKIVDDGNFLDDVPSALYELKRRKHPRVEELAQAIITENKGDIFLQKWAKDFLEEM